MPESKEGNRILLDRILDLLNDALALDAQAVTNLVAHKVPCNKEISDHPSIQVGLRRGFGRPKTEDVTTLGMIGLINGLFPTGPRIAAVYEDAGGLIQSFCLWETGA
jgi:hypothetical protein